jgi:23S rRNA (cytosine1962-C5)-methyltransferase
MTPIVVIKPGVEKSIQRRHPWIFSGAIDKIKGSPLSGENVQIQTNKGKPLGTGAFSPVSQIRVRMWTFDHDEEVNESFFEKKIQRAIFSRAHLFSSPTNAFRIINAESDGFPGLVVDRYADYLVCQFLSAGVDFWKDTIVTLLKTMIPVSISGIYERSDNEVRLKEGLVQCTGLLWGIEPPDELEIQENGVGFLVNVKQGHKTGFYLDQRDNRIMLSSYAKDKTVLNCFSYTGGFCMWALKGGAAMVKNIDVSDDALTLLNKNLALNHFPSDKTETICGDVFQMLRKYRDSNERFDLIVLDPPKFAHTSHQINKAARGYKDINLLAMKLLSPGGYLFTFSCSGHISPDLFQKIISDAALDSGREAHLNHYLYQSDDHPISLNFPEGLYLKGLVCRVW